MDPSKRSQKDYAHTKDPQAQRTRYELWAILALVVVILAASLIWRTATGQRPGPQAGWGPTRNSTAAGVGTPAAGAGMPHGVAAP